MATKKPGNTKAEPLTYESQRLPNLRDALQRETAKSEDGTAQVEKVTQNTAKEA